MPDELEEFKEELEKALGRLKRWKNHEEQPEERDRLLLLMLLVLIDVDKQLKRSNRTLMRIERLLEKLVSTVPSVTVSVSPTSVKHGDTVTYTGTVNKDTGVPAASVTVNIALTDSGGVPVGTAMTATTDANGTFTGSFTVDTTFPSGAITLTATAPDFGVSGTATFTSSNPESPCESMAQDWEHAYQRE